MSLSKEVLLTGADLFYCPDSKRLLKSIDRKGGVKLQTAKAHSGVVVPIITPLHKNRSVDVAGLRRLTRHLIEQKVDGVFLFGTSSEITRLDAAEKSKVLVAVMEECYGKVKTYMGILQSGLKSALEDVAVAKDSGVSCLVVCPPYYYRVGDREVLAYFTSIANATELPIMLYNIPQTTGTSIELDVYRSLSGVPNIVGVKDSCGSLAQLESLITAYSNPHFSVLIGSEDIAYEGMRKGADGIVPSLGNAFPKLLVDFYQASVLKDPTRLEQLNGLIQEFNAINPQSPSFLNPVATRKYALSYMGVCEQWMSAPYIDLDEGTKKQIERFIDTYRSALVG